MLVLRLAASVARRSSSSAFWPRYTDESRLKYTRAILDAIHSGELAKAEYEIYETFNLSVPTSCTGVPSELLNPAKSWTGAADFKEEVTKLGGLFVDNFKKYADEATEEVIKAGPQVDKVKEHTDDSAEGAVKDGPQVDNFEKHTDQATEDAIKAGFQANNFKKHPDEATEEVVKAGPPV